MSATGALQNSSAEVSPAFDSASGLTPRSPTSTSNEPSSTTTMPSHYARMGMVLHCFLSFVICNMDRINLSVAIIPMAKQFSWSESTKGLVQSVFFAGYMTTQILGGLLADQYGGRPILAAGVFMWSVSTGLTPVAANFSFPALIAVRVLLGVGEGVAMPAMNAIISAWIPASQRARSLSFVYSGMYAGSILGLLTAPAFIANAGWPSVFYFFGAVGITWVAVFLATTRPLRMHAHTLRQVSGYGVVPDVELAEEVKSPKGLDAPAITLADPLPNGLPRAHLQMPSETPTGQEENTSDPLISPYVPPAPPSLRELLSRKCVWAIIIAHFCCTWGYFVLLTWLPSYLSSRFLLDITQSAFLSTVPWLSMFVFANVGGSLADMLIRRSWPVTRTRKLMQSIGFVGPAVFLGLVATAQDAYISMVFISVALGFASFSQSGVYANHQDIGPHIAGTLLGISNTFASLPGLIGVYTTGVVLDVTGNNWNAVFAIAIFFYLVGFMVYNMFATSERQW